MWNEPNKEELSKLPKLYATDFIAPRDKIIFMHFFIGGCDWYAAEFDGEDLFFGFVILNNDYENAEWGYFSLQELKCIKIKGWCEIDRDLHWQQRRVSEIDKIRKCRRAF